MPKLRPVEPGVAPGDDEGSYFLNNQVPGVHPDDGRRPGRRITCSRSNVWTAGPSWTGATCSGSRTSCWARRRRWSGSSRRKAAWSIPRTSTGSSTILVAGGRSGSPTAW